LPFERALGWWDRSDIWLEASEKAEGRERSQLIKQSLDGSMTALRYWRTLKFLDPVVPKTPTGTADWRRLERAAQGAESGDLDADEIHDADGACPLTRGDRGRRYRVPGASATGLMGVARDGFDAIQALDAAKRCSSCRTPKRQGEDWAASITGTRVRGVERRQFVVLCGLCRTISERQRPSSLDSPGWREGVGSSAYASELGCAT
jgi:hypothetical protein